MKQTVFQHSWLQSIFLLLIASIAYWNAFDGAFQFDDYAVIVDNNAVHSLSGWYKSLPGIRPLLKLSYTVNWISGTGLFGFHLFNLACHLANCLLVFAILKRWPATSLATPAFIAAALFALHPVNTEAVTYLSGRSVSLMAFFYLAAFLAYFKSYETADSHANLWRTLISPMLFLAALATKETAWTLPFALMLWEYARAPKAWQQSMMKLMPLLRMMLVGFVLIFSLDSYRYLFEFSFQSRAPVNNVLTQLSGQVYLLTQLFWPFHPNIDPDLKVISQITFPSAIQIVSILGLLIIGVIQLRQRPWLGLAILWFFLHLIPTNSLVPRLDVANDRQLYLACIGPIFAVTYAVSQIFMHKTLHRNLMCLITIGVFLVLGSITFSRNADYQSEISLWQVTVEQSPYKARAWLNLGYAYRLAGKHDEAVAAYQKALMLKPDYEQARINLKVLVPD